MLKMDGEYMKTNQEDINMQVHGNKIRKMATVDRKHQHPFIKAIL